MKYSYLEPEVSGGLGDGTIMDTSVKAPKLQAIYGGDGRWDDAIAKALHMPDTMPEAIRDMWKKNLKIAQDKKVTLTPQQFAEMFVDNNFAG